MPYKILEHTADFRIKVTANNLKKLFETAFTAMADIIRPKEKKRTHKTSKRKIILFSLDSTVLLIDFLNEVLTNSHIHKEIYTKVIFKKLTETQLEAEIEGFSAQEFKEDIKAVTFYEANVKKNKNNEWETNIIFDI